MVTTTPHADHAERRIIALAFGSERDAQRAMRAAFWLQDRQRLTIHDAAFVTRLADGTVSVAETTDPTPVAAAIPTSLFGALVGTLVAGPIGFLIGGVLGGGGGALVAKLVDVGIPHRVIAELRELTRPGQTVLALLVSDVAGTVVDDLRRFRGAQVVYTPVPAAALDAVRGALTKHEP